MTVQLTKKRKPTTTTDNIDLRRVAKALVGHGKGLRLSTTDDDHPADPAACSSVGWLGVVMRSWERCKEKNNDELKKRDLSCFHLL